MMRPLFFISTAVFWLAIGGIAFTGWAPSTPPTAPQAGGVKVLSLAEVARHASAQDCWMAIHGQVYDLSTYLPEHPSKPEIILPWCGKEATEAYQTKLKGRSHSARADQALANYLVGALE